MIIPFAHIDSNRISNSDAGDIIKIQTIVTSTIANKNEVISAYRSIN